MNYQEIIYKLRRYDQLRGWHFSKDLSDNRQFHHKQIPLLLYVKDHPECTQQDIASEFVLSRAAVTKTIKKLISNGFVEKVINEKDERKHKLHITKEGLDLLDYSKKIVDDVDQLTFKGFSEEELVDFDSYLKRISDNLETDYSRDKGLRELFKNNKERSED